MIYFWFDGGQTFRVSVACWLPVLSGTVLSEQITGSRGDMGENERASVDPIFFFHHCNIDRMIW